MIPLKWIKRREEYLREREQWLKEMMDAGRSWEGRRKFLKMAAMAAGAAAANSFVPHSFQLVDVVEAAPAGNPFTFAYISDSHCTKRRSMNDLCGSSSVRWLTSTRSIRNRTSCSMAAISHSSASPAN